MTVQRKAKRKLSDISFEHEGAHVALVGKSNGGPANLHDYALVLKASNFSQEFIQKMQQVKVTLELPEFLRKFFGLYYDDADVLAAMMGYVRPTATSEVTSDTTYEDYIQSKLQAFEILKSAYDAESLADVLATLDETEYLAMLKDQQLLEKAIKKAEKLEKSKESKTTTEDTLEKAVKEVEVEDTSPACEVKEVEVSPSVVKQELEKSMTDKTQQSEVIQKEVEVVEKSQFVAIEKALEDQRVLLEKALAQVTQFEAEKKEAIAKAKTEKVLAIVKDETHTKAIAKAALSLESEDDFSAFMAAIQAMMLTVETSQMFVEKGASIETEVAPEVSPLERMLKAKFQAK